MKRLLLKTTSVVLVASLALSFAACSKNNKGGSDRAESRSGKTISADSPWFDGKLTDVDIPIDNNMEVEYTYPRLAGVDDNYVVVLTSGYYKMPNGNDINWETFNYNDYAINLLSVLDRNTTEVINSIDMNKKIPKNGYVESATYSDGKITTVVSTYDEVTYQMSSVETDIDPLTGNELDKRERSQGESNYGIDNTFKIGDYKIETSMNWDSNDNAYYNLNVISADGSRNSVELKENGVNIYGIPLMLSVGNDKAIVITYTDTSNKYYELDLKSLSVSPVDAKEYEWLDVDSIGSSFTGSDGTVYYNTPLGISKIDMKNKKTEEVFNYSWCNISRSILNYLQLVDCSDDGFLLAGEKYHYKPYESSSQSSFIIVEFDKAAKNPNAGKKVLEMYSAYGYVEEEVSEAVVRFNESSTDYFIEISDRYSEFDNYDYNNLNSEDDYEEANNKVNANMSNALAMDILNGEGPDMLLNTSNLGQLNNSNYLVDLTPYIGNLDSGKYFTNVIEASKINDKLYQLPVCYMIDGIHTDSKYAGASGVGFTTEEYEKFLNETLNGKDVIPYGQANYFTKLFNNMSEKFIVDGKADFSSPEFEQLAEFVKENVKQNADSLDMMYSDDVAYESPAYAVGTAVFKGDMMYSDDAAVYTTLYGIGSYFSNVVQFQGASAFLGIPSTDGRGPRVAPYVSIAVSAQAENVDACGEFVKLLLTDEVQENLAMGDNFVLSREAFRKAGNEAADYYNSQEMTVYDNSTGMPIGNNQIIFSEKNVNEMEKIIDSCSGINSTDASVNLILVEEMQPYFLGQKDLKNVAAVAQDRVQKVLDERG